MPARILAVVLSCALLIGGVGAPASGIDLAGPVPAGEVVKPVESRPDRVSASQTAVVQGSRVEVEASRTASTREWANPDGSFTVDAFTGPNWVQEPSGVWREVDTTLVADGEGGFTTTASPLEVTVGGSDGSRAAVAQEGSAEAPAALVSVGSLDALNAEARASDEVQIGWPGDLPAPVVSGNVASFPDVEPGVDVRVKVHPSGAETFVDLARRPEDLPESGFVVDLPLSAKGLSVAEDADGGVVLTNKAGEVVAATPQARVWDASVDPRSGLPVNEIAVDTELAKAASGWVLRVRVPVEFFDRPGLVFPVTVDPSVSVQTLGDTFVEKGYNDTNFAGEDDLRVGTYDGGTHVARSYLKFALTDPAPGFYSEDTVVTDAKLHLYEYWSSSCTKTRIDSHQATESWSATSLTWNTRTSYSSTADGSVTAALGFSSSCPAGWLNGSTGIDVTDTLGSWAGAGANQGIVLDAASETDSLSWKRFYSGEYATTSKRPYLTVTYAHRPATPTAVSVAPLANGYTNTTTPNVTASVSDQDGGNVRGKFQVLTSAGANVGSAFYSGYRSGAGATTAVASPTALTHGSAYRVRAWGDDGTYTSTSSADSAQFTVDTSKPGVSSVACTGLSASNWTTPAPSASTCTVTSTDTVSGVGSSALSVDGVPLAPTAAGANTFTLPAAARAAGYHAFTATATDRAGNASAVFSGWYGIGAAASLSAPAAGARSSRTFPVQASAPAGASRADVAWSVAGKNVFTTVTSQVRTATGAAYAGAVTSSGGVSSTGALSWSTSTAELGMAEGGSIDVRVCFTYPSSTRCATSRVQVVAHAFGGSFATAPAGPGEVALSTGEWQLGATDAALPGGNSEISVGRVWLSMAGTTDSGFGPGWQAALPADAAVGASDATVVDRTSEDGSLLLVYPDGSADIFLCTATTTICNGTNSYAPAGETALTGARLAMNAEGTALTYTDADLVATTWEPDPDPDNAGAWIVSGVSDPSVQGGATQPPAGAFGTLTVDGLVVSGDRYRAVVAPTPAGVSNCAWAPSSVTFGLARGCAALTVVTAKSTTTKPASGTAGDYPDRIKAVIATLWDPATSAVTSTVVARYGYDSAGMLVSAWDPRDALSAGPLATGYAYSNGRLTSFTPASANTGGLTPWTFGYDALGRLVSVSRAGAGTTAVVYDGIGLSGTNLPDLTPTATATWAQDVAPTRAVAVFAPGASTVDPRQGAISYLDTTGRALNTATYGAGGWNVTTTAYTPSGQVAWELTAGNRARALTPGAGDPVGLPVGDTAARARLLRTDHVYSSADPTLEVDTYGPLADVTRPDGTITSARAHTRTAYDQGAPSSLTDTDGVARPGPWRLPTEVVSSSAVVDAAGTGSWPGGGTYTDLGKQTTTTSYANTGGPADVGWLFATATQVTITGVGGQDLTTRTVLDARGRVVQTRQPGSTGSDAGTTNTVYYTGDASAAGTACDDRPEWAGLVCQVGPAAQPASGPGVPSTMSGYTRELQVNAQVETSGGITRSTTIVRDGGGREVTRTVQVTGAPAADKQVPETTTTYWPETGLVKSVTTTAGTATTSYDTLGRVTSQTDGAGNTATTSYDTAGRVATSSDGKASTSYTYNGTDAAGKAEYRGLVTATTVSGLVGASSGFTAAYDPDAALTLEGHPNGMRATTTLDPAGRETALVWTASAGGLLAASARQYGVDGNVAVDSSVGRVSRYSYDPADRLTRASSELSGAGTCTTRAYGFDADSNRTGLDTWTGTLGACPDTSTAPTTSAPRSYDPAGRATHPGYTYDGLGRTRTLPAADSPTGGEVALAYYGNDLVASMSTGNTTREYGLDALGRLASWTDTVDGATGARVVNHYADTSDRPAWTDLGNGTWTRSVTSISGDLAATITGNSTGPTATVAQVTDLHGDVVATVDNAPGAATLASATAYHEYGATTDGSAQDRYGWLGAKLRPTETFTGLILMGVRLYNTLTGRFLQVDPIPGGSAGPYLYPTNPITGFDLDGMNWVRSTLRRAATVAGVVAFGACIVATAGVCGLATGAAIAASGVWNMYRVYKREISGGRALFNVGIDATSRWARPVRTLKWARPAAGLHGVRVGRRLVPLWKQTTSPSVRLNWRFHRYRTIRNAGVQSYYGYRSAGNGW